MAQLVQLRIIFTDGRIEQGPLTPFWQGFLSAVDEKAIRHIELKPAVKRARRTA